MEISEKRLNYFLYVIQSVGIVFIAFFLVAYLGGLPSTAVLHSELAFRIPLAITGVLLLVLILEAILLAVLLRDSKTTI